MQLKLLSANLAEIYGMPQRDCDSVEIIAVLVDASWNKRDAQAHVDAAIAAGAYGYAKEESEINIESKTARARKEKN